MATPCVLYAAKSTQDKKKSIPKQLKDGRRKAAEEGWEVIGEFKDEGFSAYSGNRGPGLRDATELAERVAAEYATTCMLVAQHSDRFARGAGDRPGAADSVIEVWLRMRRVDVHLRTFQNDSMMGKPVLVAVASEQAYEESKRKSDAVKDGLERRTEKGLVSGGGRRTFGYRWAQDRSGHLVVVPAEADVVHNRMYLGVLAGESQMQIMRDLETDGVKTTSGGRWHAGTIHQILRNPMYKGFVLHQGTEIPGQHEAIVPVDLWEAVAELRRAREAAGKGRGRRPAGKYLFRKGMLKSVCGESMVPRTQRRGESISEHYECYCRMRDSSTCSMPAIRRDVVDTAIYRFFERVGLDVEGTRAQLEAGVAQKSSEVEHLLGQATADARRVEESLDRIRADYTRGDLPASDWTEFREELSEQLTGAKAEVDRLSAQYDDVQALDALRDIERDALEKLTAIRAAIAGEVTGSAGIDAARAAILRLFEGFNFRRPQPGERIDPDLAWQGEFILEPVVRGGAILRREPLYDARDFFNLTLATNDFSRLFGSIPVSTAWETQREP